MNHLNPVQKAYHSHRSIKTSQKPHFFETLPYIGLHYIDYALPQVYNAFVIIVPCKR